MLSRKRRSDIATEREREEVKGRGRRERIPIPGRDTACRVESLLAVAHEDRVPFFPLSFLLADSMISHTSLTQGNRHASRSVILCRSGILSQKSLGLVRTLSSAAREPSQDPLEPVPTAHAMPRPPV